ncbi:hypothetical protein MBLNU459_g3006t2 [Dothideomycetes sp. NU459]
MSSAVEARSLALLTTLASDPPLYPRNPTQAPNTRLVLYIVRVPGSKDVFLTPLKPREKVVSAQDVQSSLYYLHFDDPEHDNVLDTEVEDETRCATFSHSNLDYTEKAQVSRKPLPTPPMSPTDGFGFGFATEDRKPSYLEGAEHLGVPQRKPVLPGRFSASHTLDLPQIPPRLPRRPLPGRENSSMSIYSEGTSSLKSKRPLSDQLSGYEEPCQPPYKISGLSHERDDSNKTTHHIQNFPGAESEQDVGVSLTLIRRDPTSGAQWNVARIRDPPVREVSSESSPDLGNHRARKTGAPLFLDVSNPGYSKFIHFDQARPDSRGSTSTLPTQSENSDFKGSGVFSRRLWMDGSRFADHSHAHRKLPSLGANFTAQGSSLQASRVDVKSTSRAFVDRRSKGYSFRSPWGGKCEFVAGTVGRSLKCKHSLENAQSLSADVSELRFNLPSTKTLLPPARSPAETTSNRSSYIGRPLFQRHTASDPFSDQGVRTSTDSSNYFDEDGNIDLTLGQERAGGGFQGKQAKLGKLIIEDEGYKMLDLVVAANMALWWRAYGRE